MFGILSAVPGSNGAIGLPTSAAGISGVTECAIPSNMPTDNVKNGVSVIVHNGAVFAFGGEITDSSDRRIGASNTAYKYDLSTGILKTLSNMTLGRFSFSANMLSENEIFLAGKNSLDGWFN